MSGTVLPNVKCRSTEIFEVSTLGEVSKQAEGRLCLPKSNTASGFDAVLSPCDLLRVTSDSAVEVNSKSVNAAYEVIPYTKLPY